MPIKKKRNHRTCKKLIHQPNYATSANYPLHSRKPTPSIHLEQSLFAAARRGNTVGNETSPCTLFSRLSPPHTTPDGETRSVKNQTPLTFENFLARWSGTTFSLSRDRWTRVKRVRGGKERGGYRVRRIRCVEPGGEWREIGEEEWSDGGGWKGGGWRGGRQGLRDQYVCWGMWTTWVGGGQQPAAADWPTATPRPRPLPHTVS